MADDSLDASAISIDHNAMLASDPSENSAFMKVFGAFYKHSSLKTPGATMQLSQLAPKSANARRRSSHAALSRLNERLASQMQAQLTGSAHAVLHTMPVLASDSAARHRVKFTPRAAKVSSAATLDALSMVDGKTHLLPKKLRNQFIIDRSKHILKRHYPSYSSASKPAKKKAHQDISMADKADDKLLSAIPTHTNAAELVQRAAMEQMQQQLRTAPVAKNPPKPIGQPQYQQYTQAAPYNQAPYAAPYPPQQALYRAPMPAPAYYPQPPVLPTYYAAPVAAAPVAAAPVAASYGRPEYPQQYA